MSLVQFLWTCGLHLYGKTLQTWYWIDYNCNANICSDIVNVNNTLNPVISLHDRVHIYLHHRDIYDVYAYFSIILCRRTSKIERDTVFSRFPHFLRLFFSSRESMKQRRKIRKRTNKKELMKIYEKKEQNVTLCMKIAHTKDMFTLS